jgi:hypothetical protein
MRFKKQSTEAHTRRCPSLRGAHLKAVEPTPAASAHLKFNYWISACPLLVSRTSSPMTVMFSSRPTIRLMLPGIAPPAR